MKAAQDQLALSVQNARLAFGDRAIWSDLSFDVKPGEFIAVIGANGSGKSSLLKCILGQQQLTSGSITFGNHQRARGGETIGYIPQHRAIDADLPLRVEDAVRLGLDGHRYGVPLASRAKRNLVRQALINVEVESLAKKPVGSLSGGEMQRVRVAQALISQPKLILADEPLSALDLHHQQVIASLIAQQRAAGSSVLFVTHDVNPVIDYVDRVLYLAAGKYSIGTPDEVLQSDILSNLYGAEIDVVRNQGRIVVLGAHDHAHHDTEEWQ